MLNLHWDVLPPAAIGKTIWGKSKDKKAGGAGNDDEGDNAIPEDPTAELMDDTEVEELERLFSKQANWMVSPRATPRESLATPGGVALGSGCQSVGSTARGAFFGSAFPGAAAGGRAKKVLLLDVARGNNVAIGLKSFKLSGGVTELANLINALDPKGEFFIVVVVCCCCWRW